MSAPVFHLVTPDRAVVLREVDATFQDLPSGERALRERGWPSGVLAGAVPFTGARLGCSLHLGRPDPAPLAAAGEPGPPDWGVGFDVAHHDRELSRYLGALGVSLEALGAESSELEKIVVSRTEQLEFEGSVDPEVLFGRLRALFPGANNYHVRDAEPGAGCVMGASPELFLRRRGDTVSMEPLAGSLPRTSGVDPALDRENAERVLGAHKYLDEHRHLVDFMVAGLRLFCDDVSVPDEPEIVEAPGLWHIATPLEGVLRDPSVAISDLVEALHPSPAVCGVPSQLAHEMITVHEPPRGYYGGLVGWIDASGDCELYMALRGLELDQGGRHVRLRAGGGIVASSSIATEYEETVAKFGPMRRLLGVGPSTARPTPTP